MLIGFGYDIHRLVKGRELILGGVKIPFTKSLEGHSDADAVFHAICDAVIGAAGEGDIGEHFPDSDDAYKNISSSVLLDKVYNLVLNRGHRLNNIDVTIICEQPKLSEYKKQMEFNISKILHLDAARINVKAKTNEGMGEIGKSAAIAVYALVSLVI